MEYPKEFAQKAKQLYPTWTALHRMIKRGETIVSAYLAEDIEKNMRAELVLEMINAGKIDELKETAERFIARKELYQEQCQLFMNRHSQ